MSLDLQRVDGPKEYDYDDLNDATARSRKAGKAGMN